VRRHRGAGGVLTSTDPTGGKRDWRRVEVLPDSHRDDLASISCPSRSLCVAIDGRGNTVAHSTDPAGGPRAWTLTHIDAPAQMSSPPSIACLSRSLCVVVGTGSQDGVA
jgi:hypothetical protein